MNLYLVEHHYQAEDLLKKYGNVPGEWIALGPSSMHYLSNRNIPYTIPEHYCSPQEVEDACIDQFDRLRKVCDELDAEITKRDPFLKEWNIRPFLFHLWQIGMIVDGLISRRLQLKKIMEKMPDAKIFVHLTQSKPFDIFGLGFSKEETLWGRLLALPGWSNTVNILPEPTIPNSSSSVVSFKARLKHLVGEELFPKLSFRKLWPFMNLAYAFYYGTLSNGFKSLFADRKRERKSVLCIDGIFEWRYILSSLSRKGIMIYYLSSKFLQNNYLESRKTDTFSDKFWNIFSKSINKDTVDFRPMIKDRIYWIIEQSCQVAKTAVKQMEDVFIKKDIRLALSSVAYSYLSHVVRSYCHKKDIPVIGWQHGASWYEKRITQRADLEDLVTNSIQLVYGEANKKAYETSDLITACKVVTIGSVSIDRIVQNSGSSNESGNRILYVVTNYYRNGWYCGFTPPFSDRLYLLEQCCIVKGFTRILATLKNVSLTVKIHPGATVLGEVPPWIAELSNKEHVEIISSESTFAEMLNHHDIVVIDSPTTTLLQALASQLPLFILTSIISPPKADMPRLRKRAVCVNSSQELINELKSYLKTGVYSTDVGNRDFLKLYGTYLDDGKSNVRAENLVMKMLNSGVR